MWSKHILTGLICGLYGIISHLVANECLIEPTPFIVITNPSESYSLINSVDFHPNNNLFCVTCTQTDTIVIYNIVDDQPEVFQILKNPFSKLSGPQHAVFSPDGKKLVVANWIDQTLNLYRREENGFFTLKPSVNTASLAVLDNCRPHGVAFSPCGNYLAIAYGVTHAFDRVIALFRLTDFNQESCFELISLLKNDLIPGIPKGIAFSPDGTCLLVTFCDVNSLVIYNIDPTDQTIELIPRQIIQGRNTKIFRPEDVKISPDGKYCAISNSEKDRVTFYLFDKNKNLVTQNTPFYILQNPEAQFCFPHGIAFSPDGAFFVVTQFGQVHVNEHGGIYWAENILPAASTVNLYRVNQSFKALSQKISKESLAF